MSGWWSGGRERETERDRDREAERERDRETEREEREGLRLGFNTLGIATCKWKS